MTVNETRLERLLTLVQARQVDRALPVPMRICMVCPQALEVDGAGVTLLAADSRRSLGATDQIAEAIESIQLDVREGPCVDAVGTSQPSLESDLRGARAQQRWPRFAPLAAGRGAGAVFGFPLIVNSEPIGALDLYRRAAIPLSDSDVDDALLLADITALAISTSQGHPAPTAAIDLPTEPVQLWAHQAVVHHASGMTAVQLGVTVDEALLRLRAFAFAADRALADVAADIVKRRLRLEAWPHD